MREAGASTAFVVAHDMGTSVATELFARELEGRLGFAVAGALLFNGSIPLDRPGPRSASGCCAAGARAGRYPQIEAADAIARALDAALSRRDAPSTPRPPRR